MVFDGRAIRNVCQNNIPITCSVPLQVTVGDTTFVDVANGS